MVDRQTILKELFRKSIHLCSAFIPFFLKLNYWITIAALIFVLAGYLLSEILRLRGINFPLISLITKTAARERDHDSDRIVLGPVMLVLGIVVTALLFPLNVAKIGIYALAFGDGLASLGGKLYGHVEIPHTQGKTVEGSLTCFIAVVISTWCCIKNIIVSLIIGFCAMIIELLPLKDLDNLVIPVFISAIYYGLLAACF